MFTFANKGVFNCQKNLDFGYLSLKENLKGTDTKKHCGSGVDHLKNLIQKKQQLHKSVVTNQIRFLI